MASPTKRLHHRLSAEFRRKQILLSAGKLLAKRGYELTTMDEIAESANLTKGALFYHFKCKEDILVALLKFYEEQVNLRLDRLRPPVTPVAYLRELLAFRASGKRSNHGLVADIATQAAKNRRVGSLIRDMHRRGVHRFMQTVGIEAGHSSKELKQIAVIVIALFHGLGCLHAIDESLVNFEDQLQMLVKIFPPETINRTDSGGDGLIDKRRVP